MSVVFRVDAARWRAHLEQVVTANPGIVPVVKGNGYGFGIPLLLAECERLYDVGAVTQVAVGTYAEAQSAGSFGGDVLVLEPYRAALHADRPGMDDPSLIHTVTSVDDLTHLARRTEGTKGSATPTRVAVEGLTSMNRYGARLDHVEDVLAATRDLDVALVGLTLHLPLGTGHVAEVTRWVDAVDQPTWYLSHTSPDELERLRRRYPERRFLPRIGTALWLGDPGALSVRAQVLDARPVADGDRAGYRQRKLEGGALLVVSGGTAHGIALEAPSAAATLRQRAIAVAEGVLEATGRVRSPFTVDGRPTRFVEPPHMQVSLLAWPKGVAVPAVGSEVEVRVRHTTLHADEVVLS